MTSDHLFVYGTLMRGFDHPMAKLLSRSADFIGEARCRGRLSTQEDHSTGRRRAHQHRATGWCFA